MTPGGEQPTAGSAMTTPNLPEPVLSDSNKTER